MSEEIIAECVGGPYDGLRLEMPSNRPQIVRFPVRDKKKQAYTLLSLSNPIISIDPIEVYDFYKFEQEIEVEVEGMHPDEKINILTYAGRGVME